MRNYHLIAGVTAALVLVAVLVAGQAYAGNLESQYIHALASVRFQQKLVGTALQAEAFQQPDLLPVYGSSELTVPDAFHINKIFRLYPTGFAPFVVGNTGAEPLTYVLRLGSVGTGLDGKKVVILLSPQFFADASFLASHYAGNYSRLQAYELAFSTDLSKPLKRKIARRMIDYPDTLANDPLLNTSLHLQVHDTIPGMLYYYSLLPLGKLNVWILNLQDHWETLSYIRSQPDLKPAMPRRAMKVNWDDMVARAEQSYAKHADNNPFGFDNMQWDAYAYVWSAAEGTLTDQGFYQSLDQSKGWTDLDLLLRVLKEMNARPLILGIPIAGQYYEYAGISAGARDVYYQRLREAVQPYGVPLEEFEDHDTDNLFFYNPGSHLSSKGWIYFARSMDAFYHGATFMSTGRFTWSPPAP